MSAPASAPLAEPTDPVSSPPVFPPLCRLRFHFKALEPLSLPAYTGSTWHGVLGHALRGAVCVTGQPTCAGCLLTESCAYAVLFESPATDPALAKRYPALPHPYVLETEPPGPMRELAPGDAFGFGITLIGTATRYVAHLVYALGSAGERGLGKGRARFALSTVMQEQTPGADDWACIYSGDQLTPVPTRIPSSPPAPKTLRLRLETPLRLKARGQYLRTAESLTGAVLLRAIGERAELLCRLYTQPSDPADLAWTDARAARAGIRIARADLRWHDWTRFSSRQGTDMQLGGLLGELGLDGPALASVWPLLWFGQHLHAGKNSAFGLGRYRVLPADGADPGRSAPAAVRPASSASA